MSEEIIVETVEKISEDEKEKRSEGVIVEEKLKKQKKRKLEYTEEDWKGRCE